MADILAPVLELSNLLLHFIMFTILLMINWYGMWVTRHMVIKFLPAAGIILLLTENTTDLSGFPKRSESEYDSFGVGHSSTSISAALGMAMAAKYKGETGQKDVAVIGDGAMTAGLAFEAMNHAGVADTDMLIILNDNCMGIDPNVGALKEYLTDITTSPTYNKVKDDVWKLLGKLPVGKNFSRAMGHKLSEGLKGMVSSSANLFEALKPSLFWSDRWT